MARLFIVAVLALSTLSVMSCSSGDDGDGDGEKQCMAKERGIEFAPCKKDSDCYSEFCDETGNPEPYCWASSSALASGRGIACSENADCPVPADAAARGIKGWCGGSNIAQNYCSYTCKPDAVGSAGSSSGTSGSSNGTSGTSNGTSGTSTSL